MIASLGKQDPSVFSRIVFSPDGSMIAQANSSVKLWNIRTKELIRELKYPYFEKIQPEKILFSPDGGLLAVSIRYEQGHVLIWDVSSGDLLQDWAQEHSTMIDPSQPPYEISVNAMAFLPNSTKLAYATGNTIEVKDAREENDEAVILPLGKEMYASEISIRDDSEFMYVLMNWEKGRSFRPLMKRRFKIQIWHMNTQTLRRELKYPEVSSLFENMSLVGIYALYENVIEGTIEVQNLSTDKMGNYPYRKGLKYFNSDTSLMVCFRYSIWDDLEEGIEIWNTDNWRTIFTFKPQFIHNQFSIEDAAFNPDNTILAMDYSGEVYLWDIRPVDQP